MHYSYCPVCGAKIKNWSNELIVCTACGYHFYQTSKPTAGAVIITNKDNNSDSFKILLTKRGIDPYKGYWDIPGGFLKNGEQPEEGLKREIMEELGTALLSLKLFFAIVDRYPREDIPEEANCTLCLYYLCTIDENAKLTAEDDITESRWFSIDSLPENLAFTGNKKAVAEVKRLFQKKGISL